MPFYNSTNVRYRFTWWHQRWNFVSTARRRSAVASCRSAGKPCCGVQTTSCNFRKNAQSVGKRGDLVTLNHRSAGVIEDIVCCLQNNRPGPTKRERKKNAAMQIGWFQNENRPWHGSVLGFHRGEKAGTSKLSGSQPAIWDSNLERTHCVCSIYADRVTCCRWAKSSENVQSGIALSQRRRNLQSRVILERLIHFSGRFARRFTFRLKWFETNATFQLRSSKEYDPSREKLNPTCLSN